ncbi:hypothetical protein TNCV_736061 [Trichonephila clavipes]|uniref:Uncharacterized protein n=1 Tax=Trichonephila clavipes TaxID=2585209 RepID=A0A8X6VKT2_TRICX|nr:hypothetical protein TNCV_736061 [Trichonephila clavipes]
MLNGDVECLATNLSSNCALMIIEGMSGAAEGSVPILLSILHNTGPQQGVMVWGAISFNRWTSLRTVIRGTLIAQRYIDEILKHIL